MKNLLILSLVALTSAATIAAPQTYDFKDPKGVNHAKFTLDAPLETISGSANGVSGTVTIDPENPAATSGSIIVETASLQVDNPVMKEHMLGADWLDAAKNPQIIFKLKSLENLSIKENKATATVLGTFSLKGVQKEIKAPVTVTMLPGKLGERTNGQMQGDLAVIRTTFKIKRTDFGINPKAPEDKVSDEIEVSLAIAGASPKK
jgi:polyisoprenoid-binding protein YceI